VAVLTLVGAINLPIIKFSVTGGTRCTSRPRCCGSRLDHPSAILRAADGDDRWHTCS
jgi:hypothetical protein